MSFFLRAGGLAAAVISFVSGVAFANPSIAETASTAPPAISYVDHAAAQKPLVAAPQVAPEAPRQLSHDVDFSAPVIQHAIAAPAAAEAAPEVKGAKQLPDLVAAMAADRADDDELACLAGAVYFESKGEPLEGQLAVAEVIINRSQSGKFPTSLCGVVKQRSQFSFVRGGRIPPIPNNAAWRKAVAIAHIARHDLADSKGAKALFFHANYVRPGWRGLTRIGAIGNHIFYR